MPDESKYSKVYSLLVHGEDDLAGQIAYALYKQHKIEEIARFTAKNKRPPTDEELESFLAMAESENQLRYYNDRALAILQSFLDHSVTSDIEEVRKQLKAEYNARIDEILASIQPKGFMSAYGRAYLLHLYFLQPAFFFYLLQAAGLESDRL